MFGDGAIWIECVINKENDKWVNQRTVALLDAGNTKYYNESIRFLPLEIPKKRGSLICKKIFLILVLKNTIGDFLLQMLHFQLL